MSNAVAILRDAFPGATWAGDKGKARCPAHDDKRASLSLGIGADGKALVFCFAGCALVDILAHVGLKMADLFPSNGHNGNGHYRPPQPRVVATYDYRDAGGALLYRVVRLEPGRDGKSKDFRQRRPDPARPGEWLDNLDDTPRVPYRLPELLAANPDEWVFLPEGEKDAEVLVALGFVATTNAGGAPNWQAGWARHLRGRKVAILCDNDAAGRARGCAIARSLYGAALAIRMVDFRELPPGGDVSDWLALGHDGDDLLYRATHRPEWAPGDDPCPEEIDEESRHLLAQIAQARAEAADLRAEVVALKAERRDLREFALNPGADDRSFRLHVVLGFRLAETADGRPARLATKWIASDLGMSEGKAGEVLADSAARGLVVRELVDEVRQVVDKKTGELKAKGGKIYHHGYAEGVVDFGGHIRAASASYAADPLPRPGGKRDRHDPRICPGCGQPVLETHKYGHCHGCYRRFKDGVELGGARVPLHPLAEMPDPPEYAEPSHDQVDHVTGPRVIPAADKNPVAVKVLVHDQVDHVTPANAPSAEFRPVARSGTPPDRPVDAYWRLRDAGVPKEEAHRLAYGMEGGP